MFPACKHTLTRSVPLGTVGDTTGRAMNPALLQWAASTRGFGVRRAKIGEDGHLSGSVMSGVVVKVSDKDCSRVKR